MPTISCSTCGEPLPGSASYCAGCGEIISSSGGSLQERRSFSGRVAIKGKAVYSNPPAEREALLLETDESDLTIKLFHKEMSWTLDDEPETFDHPAEDDRESGFSERHATWQKVVEHKTPPTLPVVAISISGHRKRGRFFFRCYQVEPHLFFWLSIAVLFTLLLGGVFGVALSFGHETPAPAFKAPALRISPATVALGGIVTLRGTHFTPGGRLALSRDQQIPLVDTDGASSIQADADGTFRDVAIVDPAWLAGRHLLYATDVRTHQQALFPLLVTGKSVLQGPPHLLLSSITLDLGSGDETTNSSSLLALSNAGGGQLIWQASSNQPWLQISPKNGSIPSGGHASAMVAVDRARLAPGVYYTSIVFISNTEQVTLSVGMQVLPLQPAHQAVLQLSPAALTFNATASSSDPPSQVITVSNPGIRPLSWGATVALQNGSNWLWLSSPAGSISPGKQQAVSVGVSSRGLAPGVYKGVLLFTNQGSQAIQGSPQRIFVSLTVAPLCTLSLMPGSLHFTGVHGQTSPAAQTLHVGVAPGCTTSQHWNVSRATVTGGNWLSIAQNSGSTPAQPQVSINSAGLAPGNYAGTLTFADRADQQMVTVTLTISPVPCTITAPPTLSLQGTAGQAGLVSQSAVLGSSGDCAHTLNWSSSVSVTTPGGGTWLNVPPAGSFTPPSGASVAAQASLAGLSAGTYGGTLIITAVDSVTNQAAGTVQMAVTLTVLAPCALLTPSTSVLPFAASVGSDPPTSSVSFSVGVTGNCAGSVTITPSGDAGGNGWLAVTDPATIASGGTATFTAAITSSTLAAGSYSSTITLTAADGNGPISGSPQTVTVSLTVQ